MIQDFQSTRVNVLRNILSTLVYPLQYSVGIPARMSNSIDHTLTSYQTLQKQNQTLKQQQLIDKTRLLRFAALEKENIRLRALLEHSYTMGEHVLLAEVVEVNMDPYKYTVLVDKGLRFGVHRGQPVFDAYGVVGQVVRAQPLNAEVMLITDPSHAIPVVNNRNNLRTIAIGNGLTNQLLLPFLPNNADIKQGDLLISSGLGGTFPPGYPVATVDQVTLQPDKPFLKVVASASAHLNRSRELMIVWSDQTPLAIDSDEALDSTDSRAHVAD